MKKTFIFLLALVMALGISLIAAMPVAADPGTTYYVSTTGSDVTGDGSYSDPWRTIQHAVDQVSSGDTIMVAPGTYTGAIVGKDVTISGLGPGDSVIDTGVCYNSGCSPAYKTGFRLDAGADGAEISDFTINCDVNTSFYFAIFARAVDDVTIDNLEINDTVQGISNWGGSGWEITNNTITDTVASGGGGIGIFLGARAATSGYGTCCDNLVQYNTIDASASAEDYSCPAICLCYDLRYGGYLAVNGSEDISGNQILDNTVTASAANNLIGIEVGTILGDNPSDPIRDDPDEIAAVMTAAALHDNTVEDNTVDGADTGIYFYNVTNLTITENTVQDNVGYGMYAEHGQSGTIITDNTFTNNDVQLMDDTDDTDTLDPLDIAAILSSNTFDRAVTVDHPGASLLHTIWSSIQDGIDAAVGGDTVNVSAGTYNEQVLIDKSLNLVGSGDDQTFVKATGSPVISVSANNVTIQDLEITDDTQLVEGIRIVSGASTGLTVDHVDITELGAGTGANAYGIYIANSFSNLLVTDCDFVAVTHATSYRTIGIFAPNNLVLSDFEVSGSTFQTIWTGIYLRSAIDGLDVTGSTFGSVQSSDFTACVSGIYIGDGSDYNFDIENVVVANNTFTDYGRGVYVWNYANDATVSNFEIYENTFTNSVWSSGIRFIAGLGDDEGVAYDGISIHDNIFTQNSTVGAHVAQIDFRAYCELADCDIAVTDNEITLSGGPYTDPWTGIAFLAYEGPFTNTVVDGNTMNGGNCGGAGTPPSTGVLLKHESSTYWPSGILEMDITNNAITGFDHGVGIYDNVAAQYGGLPTGCDVNINYNEIHGNTLYGVINGNSEAVDATANWWGDASGPYNATTNPSGTGDSVSDNVDYSPWWGANYIDVSHPWEWYTNDSIQEAVDAASAGDTINVMAGTYIESPEIVIDKNLSMIGAGSTNTTIKPSGDTASNGAMLLVDPDVTFHISDVTLDGTGKNVWYALKYKGGGSVTDCDFKNIQYYPSGPNYQGIAICAYGEAYDETIEFDDNVDITGCTFTDIGRVGVLYFGPGITDSTYSGNTYVGKGDGDWLDYALDVGSGPSVTIADSTISDCTGVASSDGSTSAGIMVTDYYKDYCPAYTSTEAVITGNNISGCTSGIAVGYDETDLSVATISSNTFEDNRYQVDCTPNVDVDLEDTLTGNTFDRAVVVRGSGIKVPTIFSSIQDAIDAAVAGDTVEVAVGTYAGFEVTKDDLTIQGPTGAVVSGAASGRDAVVYIGSDVDSMAIQGLTIDAAGVKCGIRATESGTYSDIAVLDSIIKDFKKSGVVVRYASEIQLEGNHISTTDHSEAPNGIQVGNVGDTTGTTGTIESNQISGCHWDGYDPETETYEDDWTGSGILVIDTSSALNISDNEVHSCDVGMDIESGTPTAITNNDVHDNSYGFVLWNAAATINYNAIHENALYGVYCALGGSFSDVDATANWWGALTGPYHEELNPDGEGDDVSDHVLFEPWYGDEGMTTLVGHSTYEFVYDLPDVVVALEETDIPVTFQTDELGAAGYYGVRFKFDATGPGNVIFKATDSEEFEHTFVNSGFWGPSAGFNLTADYSDTTDWSMNFSEPGEYNVTFSLIEAPDGDVVAAIEGSEDITVRAVDIIDHYRHLHEPFDEVTTLDLLAAADDWIANEVPPGFDEPITTMQLLALADEWFSS